MDITDVILFQHHEQRRGFALLDDLHDADPAALAAAWSRLAVLLEVHAEAEEKFFYPRLLELGTGEGDGPTDEVEDAIKDHNDIRDGIREVAKHQVGSDAWWSAVRQTRTANGDHMAEEERDDLADFRRHADLQTRHDIAVEFLGYENTHAAGIKPVNKDPEAYVQDPAGEL